MARLLKFELHFRGRLLCYDLIRLNFLDSLGCHRSSSSASRSSAGKTTFPRNRNETVTSSTDGSQEDKIVRQPKVLWRVEDMRSRMRELHGLNHDITPSYEQTVPENVDGDSNQADGCTPELDETSLGNITSTTDASEAKRQLKFIRMLRRGEATPKSFEKVISAPFGMMRVDEMNWLPGRRKEHKKSEDQLNNDSERLSRKNSSEAVETHGASEYKKKAESGMSELKHIQTELNKSTPELGYSEFQSNLSKTQDSPIHSTAENEKERTHNNISAKPLIESQQDASVEAKSANIFDQQYFGDCVVEKRNANADTSASVTKTDSFFEEQYFNNNSSSTSVKSEQIMQPESFSEFVESHNLSNYSGKTFKPIQESSDDGRALKTADKRSDSKSMFEEQYFEQSGGDGSRVSKFEQQKVKTSRKLVTEPEMTNLKTERKISLATEKLSIEEKTGGKIGKFEQRKALKTSEQIASESEVTKLNEDTIFHETVTKREMKLRSIPFANIENPTTAYDVAMKIRFESRGNFEKTTGKSEKPAQKLDKPGETGSTPQSSMQYQGKLDSKGFRILKDQVLDLQRVPEDVVLNILKDSVLYEDDKLVAIDKPYGLPSHGGPGIHNSVGKFLQPLALKLDKTGKLDTLHLVHRLDKETTGVMVLAKSQQTAELLLAMFKKRMVVKRYWAITKGVPNPTEGVIDIPMAEGCVKDRYRMELRPIYLGNTGRLRRVTDGLSGERLEAVTNYKVLSSYNDDTALVECEPETGVKHQIRCHLAFGLNTPILGDHKYSHYSKFAPQRLYPGILQRLKIRQSKVRHLPMHLHARVLILPEFKDGQNLFISARIPKHFLRNLERLKLEIPG